MSGGRDQEDRGGWGCISTVAVFGLTRLPYASCIGVLGVLTVYNARVYSASYVTGVSGVRAVRDLHVLVARPSHLT